MLLVGTVGLSQAPSFAAGSGGIHDDGIQELDGSIDFTGNSQAYGVATGHDQSIETSAPYDWSSLFTGNGSGGSITTAGASCQPGSCAGLISDVGLPYTGDLFTQGSKDVGEVSSWTCTQQSTPPKDQLVNTYAAAWTAQQTAGAITAGDTVLHMGLERPNTNGNSNAGFWLFKKKVICDPTTGSFSGNHSNGDVFLVGSFVGGGTNAVLTQYVWTCPTVSTTDSTCASAGSLTLKNTSSTPCPDITVTTDVECQVVNQSVSGTGHSAVITNWNVLTPWSNIATGTAGVPGPGFLEIGIDLSAALATPGQEAPCFASFLADTRSSGSSTQAETKNFINGNFPTCGNLSVKKYIDADLDPNGGTGDINGGPDSGDVTSGTGVAGWGIDVSKGGTALCSGHVTGTDGSLPCGTSLNNIPNGTALSVTEHVPAAPVTNTAPAPATDPAPGFFNTDPGVMGSGSVSSLVGTDVTKSVTMGASNQTVYIGNECFVNFKFTVTGVPNTAPTATQSLTVSYSISGGNYNGATQTGTIALQPTAAGSSTWTGLVQNKFVQNDTFTWTWQSVDFSGNTSSVQPNSTGISESLSSDGYSTCKASDSTSFNSPIISGVKYKDANHDGFRNAYTNPIDSSKSYTQDPLLGGFTMSLYAGASCGGTALATTTTSGTHLVGDLVNNYTFGARAPGSYSVRETSATGWKQTGPVVSSAVQACVPVTAVLGDSTDSPAAIGNTPLSTIASTFTSLTGTTNSQISCTPAADSGGTSGAFTASPSPSPTSTSGSYSASGVEDGKYVCTVIVADP